MFKNNYNKSGDNPFNPRGNENINNIYNMNSNRSYGQEQQEWSKNSSALSVGMVKYNRSKRQPKKAMKMPLNVMYQFLENGLRLQIWLYNNNNIRIEGKMIGFDEYLNMVLDETEELDLKKQTRRQLGRIMLKGDNICLMSVVK